MISLAGGIMDEFQGGLKQAVIQGIIFQLLIWGILSLYPLLVPLENSMNGVSTRLEAGVGDGFMANS
jgi:hypothetical protein